MTVDFAGYAYLAMFTAMLGVVALLLWRFPPEEMRRPPLDDQLPEPEEFFARVTLERCDDSIRHQLFPRPASEKAARGFPWIPTGEVCCQDFLRLGFQDLGTYAIRETAHRLAFFWHSDPRIMGLVSIHPRRGVSAEVGRDYPSGLQIFVTNQNFSQETTKDSDVRNHYLLGASVEELLRRLEEECANIVEQPLDFTGEDPAGLFERDWARKMDNRIARAVDEDEVRRFAAAAGSSLTEEQFEWCFEAEAERYSLLAEHACLDNFLHSGRLTPEEIASHGNNLLVVHCCHSDGQLKCAFLAFAGSRKSEAASIAEKGDETGLDLFAWWCAATRKPLYRLVGKVDRPIEAHIYLCEALESNE